MHRPTMGPTLSHGRHGAPLPALRYAKIQKLVATARADINQLASFSDRDGKVAHGGSRNKGSEQSLRR